DRSVVVNGATEISAHQVREVTEILLVQGSVEPDFPAQGSQVLDGGTPLGDDDQRRIARQDMQHEENQRVDAEQGGKSGDEASEDQSGRGVLLVLLLQPGILE